MATAIPPLVLDHPLDNPDHYEFVRGHWSKKESVGREDHSELESVLTSLLKPIAKRLGCKVLHEWTIVSGEEKLIPDVTFSFPNWKSRDGYLAAPALLVVESCSKGQRLNSLFDKCRLDYHRIGTPYCWVLDAEKKEAFECHRDDPSNRLATTLTAGPEISLSVADLGW